MPPPEPPLEVVELMLVVVLLAEVVEGGAGVDVVDGEGGGAGVDPVLPGQLYSYVQTHWVLEK